LETCAIAWVEPAMRRGTVTRSVITILLLSRSRRRKYQTSIRATETHRGDRFGNVSNDFLDNQPTEASANLSNRIRHL